jgi:hypothetical protein
MATKKKIKLTPDLAELFEKQRTTFIKKFGREPGPDEPIFFDPDKDTPQPIDLGKVRAALEHAMIRAGIAPARMKEILRRLDSNEPNVFGPSMRKTRQTNG